MINIGFGLNFHSIESHTWSIGPYSAWVGLWSERSTRLELGIGELRQVGHHTHLIYLGVTHLLGLDELENTWLK